MPLRRRDFLKRSVFAAGGTALLGVVGTTRIAYAASGGFYWPNQAPLQAAAFYRLPPGSVTAQGWLAGQLQLQLQGLGGQYNHISHFLDINSTGWVHPANTGWEEVPYWLRGYGDLAYVTGDATALTTIQQWLNAILATQQTDGFFGPTSLRTALNGGPDFWPFMPLVRAFCSFQEYSNDARIVPFLTKYFQYMNTQATSVFTQGWGYTRWGDTIESIYWLYNRTGASWLLDLVRKIHQNSANWMNSSALPTLHNVNLSQGFREPALYGLLAGGSQYKTATYQNYAAIQNLYGQFPGGGFAGDENARPSLSDPRQGFETCGIVEYMQSHEILTRITGDPVWADRTENLAFNSLPAALDPQGKALHYITSANSIQLDNVAKSDGQFQNTWAMQAYLQGVDQYRCCPHNYGMGWPFFAEETWLATPDNGLCAALYAPTTVTAKVGDGTSVTFTEVTSYPFSDTITLTLSTPKALAFPLYLRIPGWCAHPVLQVNGQNVPVSGGPLFASINRTWSNGDTVTLQLARQNSLQTWTNNHSSVSVSYGALNFALQIGENYSLINNSTPQIPEYQVTPTTAWNYGLVLDANNPAQSFTVNQSSGPLASNPF
ncbi:MAG TPA: beta-L-arabinofuranosidase domain-containing protein, partial [Ktedonobacteraceae bacterium]|nr:beta-L-arabinofuranosidase domain-containing protein [Ktedonobacteraceae bacterium]